MKKFEVEEGDKIYLKSGTKDIGYIVDGPLKDAYLGSEITGGDRFYMNEEDANVFLESEEAEHMTM